ncbi:hypothetical protein ACM64Y_12740 [Novispirillum sp. DQ9]|uniref:hypothetical protein n=1 Tax=Novispirillum sp. DQ9 TaxID=3398612 RepID=UPI003C7DF8F7
MHRRSLLALLALAPLLAAPPALAQSDAATLRVLSLNIHGLPGLIAKDEPEKRIPVIARKAAAYDITLLQEDFSHQAAVDANTRHSVIVRGNGPSGSVSVKGVQVPVAPLGSLLGGGPASGWTGALTSLATTAAQPFGSGLTFIANPAAGRVVAEQRQAFGMCEGYLGAAQDCFAEKGVLMVRLRLANGTEVDVYNTHLEAGGGDKDQSIRVKQLSIITDFMKRHSAGRAVVFGGDFNLDWKNRTHRQAMTSFLDATGLERLETAQSGRQIDHILIRSGTATTITAQKTGVAPDFQHDGKPLSDHPPLTTTLRVTRR